MKVVNGVGLLDGSLVGKIVGSQVGISDSLRYGCSETVRVVVTDGLMLESEEG